MELMEGLKAKFREMGTVKFSEKYSRLRPTKMSRRILPVALTLLGQETMNNQESVVLYLDRNAVIRKKSRLT